MITPKKIYAGNLEEYVMNTEDFTASLSVINEMVHLINAKTLKPIFTNKSILHILGYSKAQIDKFGDAWAKLLVHPDDFDFLAKHIANYQHLSPLERTRVIYRVKDPKNHWHYFESVSTGLSTKDDSRSTAFVLGITRKLTDSKTESSVYSTDHRCTNCNKLLGRENLGESIEIKCSRCGEFNHLKH